MFDSTTILKGLLVFLLSLSIVVSFGFAVFAVRSRQQTLKELHETTQWAIEEHQKIQAEYLRLEQAYEELERMPDTLPNFKIQAF